MNRREMLMAMAAASGTQALAQEGDMAAEAAQAFVWGLPLLEFARVRAASLSRGLPANRFQHMRALADHRSRWVTTPNNDTTYSVAFLDLRQGPATLQLPASGERYLSVQLMDAYTNSFRVLGTRTMGTGGGRFTIVGPGGEAAANAVRSPTPWVWALGRVLVDGPEDLAAAHAVQDGLVVSGPAGPPPPAYATDRDGPAAAVLTAMRDLARELPPPAGDPMPARLDRLVAALASPEAAQRMTAGLDMARARLKAAAGSAAGAVDGWTYPRPTLGNFGDDFAYRAGVAMWGLGALPPAEAMYVRPVPSEGRRAFEAGAYRLKFAPGRLPPVAKTGGFWSLTMYEVDPSGQLWLTENPIARYAIGDRTPGLKAAADGGLELLLSPDDPGEALRSNWLPAPRGPWSVVMRCYLPQPDLLEGRYRLPPLIPA